MCEGRKGNGDIAQKCDDIFMTNCRRLQSAKSCQNILDKQKQKCYNVQADHKRVGEKYRKKVEKTFPKPLDKRIGMWYNSQAVRKKDGLKIARLSLARIIDN